MAQLPSGEAVPADGLIPTTPATDTPWSVYLHIPFCTVRCGYCDFNTYTANELRGVTRSSFVDDLIAEIEWSAKVLTDSGVPLRSASTVFIGGGTPSLLPASDIQRILSAVRSVHGVHADAEVTMEANPDTVTDELVEGLAATGVTRLSIGMQSAVPRILDILERTHNPDSVELAVNIARRAGLQTSVDLIYGSPTETPDEWRTSLETAVSLNTDHVSAYALIVEEGTALERQIRRGELPDIDDDAHADAYEIADEILGDAGFDWYEVSNWSRSEATRSRHNLAYWSDSDWWGYGPGSHSHVAGTRWWNVKHPAAYAERVSAGISPGFGREILSEEQRHDERVLLGVRLRDGLNLDLLTAPEKTRVGALVAEGLVDGAAALAGRLVLTLRGRLLADLVVRRILE